MINECLLAESNVHKGKLHISLGVDVKRIAKYLKPITEKLMYDLSRNKTSHRRSKILKAFNGLLLKLLKGKNFLNLTDNDDFKEMLLMVSDKTILRQCFIIHKGIGLIINNLNRLILKQYGRVSVYAGTTVDNNSTIQCKSALQDCKHFKLSYISYSLITSNDERMTDVLVTITQFSK